MRRTPDGPLRPPLPWTGCFLRLDRDPAGLWVTDYPARQPEGAADMAAALTAAGYTVAPDGALWKINLSEDGWRRLTPDAPPPRLSGAPEDFSGLYLLLCRSGTDSLPAARRILRACWSGEGAQTLRRALGEMYALALRRHEARPGRRCAFLLSCWAAGRADEGEKRGQ